MYVPPLHSYLATRTKTTTLKLNDLINKGRAQAAIVNYGLKRFTSGLEHKYLEITADIFSCSVFFVVVVFIKK